MRDDEVRLLPPLITGSFIGLVLVASVVGHFKTKYKKEKEKARREEMMRLDEALRKLRA